MHPYFNQTLQEVYQNIKTREDGLVSSEIEDRMKRYGPNQLPIKNSTQWSALLLRQFKNPLIYLLLIAAGITLWIGALADTVVIALAVSVNVGIGFYQEFHSGNIFTSLQQKVKSTAFVIRNHAPHEISSSLIVPGDIIILKSGSKIPADARLIYTSNLTVDESLLTGESIPVVKKIKPLPIETALADRSNMVYMGTVVEGGEARAVVTETGTRTEIGKIAELTHDIKEEKTPLQERIAHLGRLLAFISSGAVIIILITGIIQGRPLFEMLTTAVAVAVASIPEGLPAALSVVLAVSARKIYQKKGLIKRLIAAETLGSTTVICTDKTGTLTEGKMKLEKMHLVDETPQTHTRALYVLGLANEALIDEVDGKHIIRGESTDQAKLKFFLASGKTLEEAHKTLPQVAFLPFDNFKKYMASLHKTETGYLLLVTGAIETLLEKSNTKNKESIQKDNESFANQSFRVIGLCARELPAHKTFSLDNPESIHALITNLSFLGMGLLRDPIREDVHKTVIETRLAGITIIMLTGDHRLTARAIGKELGFNIQDNALMDGTAIDALSDDALQHVVRRVHIFSRVTPTHKLRIVRALQSNGEAVTMTGDGVNDTPSLKAADIGVALGSGTDIAKEASELVLLDDSFSTIVSAIKQGRIALDNIRKVIIFLLNGAFTEIILVTGALILGLPLPLTAVQILWINLVEDGLPNFALAFERGEKDVMKRPPVPRNERILNPETRSLIFIAGLLGDVLLIGLFVFLSKMNLYELVHLQSFFFAAVGADALISIFALKSLTTPLYKTKFLDNHYLLFAVMIGLSAIGFALYHPFFNAFLQTTPLAYPLLLLVLVYLMVKVGIIEFIKWRYNRRTIPHTLTLHS